MGDFLEDLTTSWRLIALYVTVALFVGAFLVRFSAADSEGD